jgi:ketosteroid isomerase-like protein
VKSIKWFAEQVTDLRMSAPVIHRVQNTTGTDEQQLWAENIGDATVVATQRQYHQNYVIFVKAQNGKIMHFREYWDPTRVVKSFVK